jgi:uncharacterized protein YkwD
MRASIIASAIVTLLLFNLSIVNAAPVANAEDEDILIKRDTDRTTRRNACKATYHTDADPTTTKKHEPHSTETESDSVDTSDPPAPTDTGKNKHHKSGSDGSSDSADSSDSSGSSDSSAPNSDAQGMLDAHNKRRALHGVDPLTWSDTLASFAQSYASNCVFEHSGGNHPMRLLVN